MGFVLKIGNGVMAGMCTSPGRRGQLQPACCLVPQCSFLCERVAQQI